MPGWRASTPADTTPMRKPSSSAYAGAVRGDQCFFHTVTHESTGATTRQINRPIVKLWRLRVVYLAQIQRAMAITQKRRKAARLIVPSSVMVSASPARTDAEGSVILRNIGFLVPI